MSNAVETGTCLCGACSFTAAPGASAGVCHCSMCRKFSGGMFMVADVSGSLSFAEGAPIGVYNSSDWGERVFCTRCGSSLAWRSKDGKMAFASIQAFADPARFALDHEIYFDCKPGNYALANQTKTMTEAELLAQVAAGGGAH